MPTAALSDISPVVSVLLGHRAVDVFEHRADRLDRLRDPVHGIDRARGVLLQRLDLLGDFLGGVLGLHRERLDLGGDHRKAAPGGAGPRRLDGGVERQQRGLPRDLRDQVDDIADRGRGFPQAVDIEAGFSGGGAGLIGKLAGVAHLRADALRRMGELLRGLRKRGRGALRGAGAPGQGLGALADGGKRRGRGLGATRDRVAPRARAGGSWRPVRVRAVRGFPWRNCCPKRWEHRPRSRALRPPIGGGRSRFRQTLSKQTERHEPLSEQLENETDIFAFGHEVRVNDCLMRRQRPLPPYRKRCKSLILPLSRPITPRLSIHPGRIRKERPHGRTFPIQEHHAPQGPAGCPEVEAVQQAGAGNHGRGQDGPARSRR